MKFDEGGHDERVSKILTDENATYEENIVTYCEYLKKNLNFPVLVQPYQDFRWEEKYIIDDFHSQEEYEEMKKDHPSCDDTFYLKEIDLDYHSDYLTYSEDIRCLVQRKSDNKEFIVGLADLEVIDEESKDYHLLSDYNIFICE